MERVRCIDCHHLCLEVARRWKHKYPELPFPLGETLRKTIEDGSYDLWYYRFICKMHARTFGSLRWKHSAQAMEERECEDYRAYESREIEIEKRLSRKQKAWSAIKVIAVLATIVGAGIAIWQAIE